MNSAFERVGVERAPSTSPRFWLIVIKDEDDPAKDRKLSLTRSELIALSERLEGEVGRLRRIATTRRESEKAKLLRLARDYGIARPETKWRDPVFQNRMRALQKHKHDCKQVVCNLYWMLKRQ